MCIRDRMEAGLNRPVSSYHISVFLLIPCMAANWPIVRRPLFLFIDSSIFKFFSALDHTVTVRSMIPYTENKYKSG